MSNEIPVGSRWRWPGGRCAFTVTEIRGDVAIVVFDDGHQQGWWLSHVMERCTRIDAPPAVKVGDVVRDPALLVPGMRVEWAGTSTATRAIDSSWTLKTEWSLKHTREAMRYMHEGIRIIALPEPAKAEAPTCRVCGAAIGVAAPACTLDGGTNNCRSALRRPPPPPARCAPGCTPAAPCRTEGVCPVFAEEKLAIGGYGFAHGFDGTASGIAADLPPARRHTPPTLRHEGACIAGWNGREGRR